MTLDIHKPLVADIEAFIAETGMGESYFGRVSCGNSELLSRLRSGKSILVKTDYAVKEYMKKNKKRRKVKA